MYKIKLAKILFLWLLTHNSYCQVSSNRYEAGFGYIEINKLDQNGDNVKVSLCWENSWRDGENWDAAWVFLKNESGGSMRIEQVLTEEKVKIKIPADNVGFFIYRDELSNGNNNWILEICLNKSNEIITPHALEMVYIPTGPFELGSVKSFSDRNSINTSRGSKGSPLDAFFEYKSDSKDFFGGVYKIINEDKIKIGEKDGNLFYIDAVIPGTNTFSGDKTGVLSQKFPKGYHGFYQMKYELSEQEYCNFLNSLSVKNAKGRINLNLIFQGNGRKAHRNTIYFQDDKYQTKRPHRPCNFLSWKDILAYADWAGLRPMTELEFEKSARGPKSATWREFVWGVSELEKEGFNYSTVILDENGELADNEDGDEYTDGNANLILLNYKDYNDVCTPSGAFYQPGYPNCRSISGGDGGRGPLRKGIHAIKSEGNRVKAGASYYGAMDLGGNLQEPVIPVGSPFSRKFKGSHGDGILDKNGEATNADWIAFDDKDYVFGFRGGSWPYHENHARTADRFDTYRTGPNERKPYRGFRGVRIAPGTIMQ